jgi:hypothetical protein
MAARRVATVETDGEYYTSLHYHIVFSTKNRHLFLGDSIRERVFGYLGRIAPKTG